MGKLNDEILKLQKKLMLARSYDVVKPRALVQSIILLYMSQKFPDLYDTKQTDTGVRRLKQIESFAPTLNKIVGSCVQFLQDCLVLRITEDSSAETANEFSECSKFSVIVKHRCYLTRSQIEACLYGVIQARKNNLAPEVFYEYSVKIVDVLASSHVLSPDLFYKILTLKNPQYALCILRGIKCHIEVDVNQTHSNNLLKEYANQVIENSESYADRFVFFAMCHLAVNMESFAPQKLFDSDEVNSLLGSELFKSKRLTKALIDLPLGSIRVRLVKQIVGMVKENTPLDRVLAYLGGARDSHDDQFPMDDSIKSIVNEYKDMCEYWLHEGTADEQLIGVGLFGSTARAADDDGEPAAQPDFSAAAS